jgi:DNA-binding NarL/FixJ family response regulator
LTWIKHSWATGPYLTIIIVADREAHMGGSIDHCRKTRFAPLTPREQEVVLLFAHGASAKSVSQILGLSHRTVESHASTIIRKLGARNRTHAVALAVHAGIGGPDLRLDRLPTQCLEPTAIAAA